MTNQEAIETLRTKVEKMQAFMPTDKDANAIARLSIEVFQMAIAALETQELKDQGMLVQLPCKKGDIVYLIGRHSDGVYDIVSMKVQEMDPFGKCPTWNICAETGRLRTYKSFYDFGRTMFTSKEEAEERLKEMERRARRFGSVESGSD